MIKLLIITSTSSTHYAVMFLLNTHHITGSEIQLGQKVVLNPKQAQCSDVNHHGRINKLLHTKVERIFGKSGRM